MKAFFRLIALCLFLAAAPALAAQYSSILSDLPLMPGLTEKPDSIVMFDKPEGRIAEITMTTARSQLDVLSYYREALPALGWYAENPQVWKRKGEILTLRFTGHDVIFHLAPAHPRAGAVEGAAPIAPGIAPGWKE